MESDADRDVASALIGLRQPLAGLSNLPRRSWPNQSKAQATPSDLPNSKQPEQWAHFHPQGLPTVRRSSHVRNSIRPVNLLMAHPQYHQSLEKEFCTGICKAYKNILLGQAFLQYSYKR